MTYELFYHASNPGRGEFIRIPLEGAQAAYVDVAREPDGLAKMTRFMQDASVTHPQFAPPFLKHRHLAMGQTASILLYLGPRLILASASARDRLGAYQMQRTISYLQKRIHHTPDPATLGLSLDDPIGEELADCRHSPA